MRAIFVSYNQAFHEEILNVFMKLNVKGYTAWEEVTGRGSVTGEPHLGTHTWPILNSSMLVFAEDTKAEQLMQQLNDLNTATPQQGLRAFWWEIGGTI
ncbi:MAG: hypothetical protein R3Y26_01160 [Rikenellaceae bacterium]